MRVMSLLFIVLLISQLFTAGITYCGELENTNRFTAIGSSECVTDNLTGLMWVRSPDHTKRTWQQALEYADGLSLCGYTDWRLPNVDELNGLLSKNPASLEKEGLRMGAGLNDERPDSRGVYAYWTSTPGESNGTYYIRLFLPILRKWSSGAGDSSIGNYVWAVRSER